jgi:hypothetical protein
VLLQASDEGIMELIKNSDLLRGILDDTAIKELNGAAAVHLKHSNIEFTVVGIEDDVLKVSTEQGKTNGKYANHKTLIKRTGEVFDKYLPSGYKLSVEPTEFEESPAMVVTAQWLDRKMLEKEVRIKQIAFDTGLDRKDIAGWVSGERTMSQIVKAMFFFYFKSL